MHKNDCASTLALETHTHTSSKNTSSKDTSSKDTSSKGPPRMLCVRETLSFSLPDLLLSPSLPLSLSLPASPSLSLPASLSFSLALSFKHPPTREGADTQVPKYV